MKNNTFERVLLALILVGVAYIAVMQSKKPESKTDHNYQLLPYNGSGDTTAGGGSTGGGPGPRKRSQADTLLIYGDVPVLGGEISGPCGGQMLMYALVDTTRGGGPGPRYMVMTAIPPPTDDTTTKTIK